MRASSRPRGFVLSSGVPEQVLYWRALRDVLGRDFAAPIDEIAEQTQRDSTARAHQEANGVSTGDEESLDANYWIPISCVDYALRATSDGVVFEPPAGWTRDDRRIGWRDFVVNGHLRTSADDCERAGDQDRTGVLSLGSR